MQLYLGDDEDNQFDFWFSYSHEFETEGDVGRHWKHDRRHKHPYEFSFDYSYDFSFDYSFDFSFDHSYDFSFYHSYDYSFEFGESAPRKPPSVRTATSLDVGSCWERKQKG